MGDIWEKPGYDATPAYTGGCGTPRRFLAEVPRVAKRLRRGGKAAQERRTLKGLELG